MFKKFAFIAIAAAISSAAVISSAAPVAAQGISVQLGNGGGGYRGGHRDGYRGDGYGRGRAEYVRRDRGHHRGWDRRPRGRNVIITR